MVTLAPESSIAGTMDPGIAYDRGTIFVLSQGDSVFSYTIESAMWKRRKSAAGGGVVARGRGALGALSQQANQVVAFGGYAPPFLLVANDLDPITAIQTSAQPFPANASYQFALVNGQFMFLSHGGELDGGASDQTMRFAKLAGIGVCSSGQLMCTAPETCWNTRRAPFQDCVAPLGTTPAPISQLYFCLKTTSDAREMPCSTAKSVRSLAPGTKLGPFESIASLPTGCDDKQWLPLQADSALLYVPLADTADCNSVVQTPAPMPAMIGSLPLTEGIIAIAVGCGLGLLLCCLIIVCIVRNRKFPDDDHGEGGRGKSGGADHRTSAIELKQQSQSGLSKGYSSQNLSNSFTGGQTASSTDRASIDDSFPSYSTAGGSGPPQRALTQGYMPTDAFARSSDFSASTIIERSALQLRGEIGRGGYGVVYKGDLRGMLVAVKCIGEGLSAKDRQDFEQEAKLLQSLPPHENVVRLIGVAYEGQSPMIVLEYLAGGSLIDLLESSIKIGRPQIVDWLRGVSAGMVHLRNHNIIHRDLAARNVMLGARGEPKVTDFGMSRFVENTADAQHVTASSVGPLKWMSPQSLLDKVWNEKSDVWAFGVLMYEVIAREEPYADLEPVQVAAQVCRDGITLEPPTTFGHDLVELLRECMRWEDTGRPTFRQINQKLMGMSRV